MKAIISITRYIIISIAIPVGLSSCIKKEDNILKSECPGSCTVVKGSVTTTGGREGLGNIPIEVKWKNTGSLPFTGGTVRRKAKTRTNANGFYELKFLIQEDELTAGYIEVTASVDKSKYLVYGNEMPSFTIPTTRDTTITADYLIPRKAFIEAMVTNPTDVNLPNGDYFGSGFNSAWGLNANQQSGSWISWYSYQPNQKFTVEVAADQQIIVETLRTKNKIRTQTYDTLLIPAGRRIAYTAEF